MKTYAAYVNNDYIRDKSSSGGLFSLIATQFDVVYGVTMTEDCYGCEFIRVEESIDPLRGSKYFQAKIGDTFKQVKKDLDEGKRVLFSGTGCQINGLSAFLGGGYSTVFLLDIVCHGVPSSKLWKEYVQFQEKQIGKLRDVNFRSKDNGWRNYGMKINDVFIPKESNIFMIMFLSNLCLRPSCYECHAKTYKKADMSIGDFWGIECVVPNMDDDKGTSLVITRTDKGDKLFKKIRNQLKYVEVSYEDGVKENSAEFQSVSKPIERDRFYMDMASMSFEKLTKKYIYISLWKRVQRKIKHIFE